MDGGNKETNYSFIRDDVNFATLLRDTTSAAEVLEKAIGVDNNDQDEDENVQRELELALEMSEKSKEREERRKEKERKKDREEKKKKEVQAEEETKRQRLAELTKLKELRALQQEKLKPGDKDILVIILDHDAQQPYLRRKPELFNQVLTAVTMLGNTHMLGRSDNELAFIGCSRFSVNFVQPDRFRLSLRCLENPLDASDFADFTTKARIHQQILQDFDGVASESESDSQEPTFSLLSGAIGKALCYIQRRRREINLNMPKGVQLRVEARVLIVTATEPPSHLYTNYMHMINGAKTANVSLDLCILDRDTLPIWRQATQVTGGFYYSTNDFDDLLTRLLGIFLISPVERFQFSYPDQPPVDNRPWCVCHRTPLDIGFVCSTCLSVHCKYTPICRVCDSFFKPPRSLEDYIKGKKLKRKRSTSM